MQVFSKSWSVVVGPEAPDEDGDAVLRLFNYSAYGRLAEDARSGVRSVELCLVTWRTCARIFGELAVSRPLAPRGGIGYLWL